MTKPPRRILDPYDTGEILEPAVWTLVGPDPAFQDFSRYGKVDFENDESTTLITVRAKPIDFGRGVMLEVESHFDGIVRVVVDGRAVDIHTR